jgi:hypothetical protein
MGRLTAFLAILGGLAATAAAAGEVTVVAAEARRQADGAFAFSVTLEHGDSGWKHYADRWEVVAPDGTVLATRVLLHPHVDEQPFTRSLSGVKIPAGISRVTIRAHDKVHGNGPLARAVDLPR